MKQINYILVTGAARSGKSTLRKKVLQKYGLNGFCTDSLVSMLMHAHPELGISFEMEKLEVKEKYVTGLLQYLNDSPVLLEGIGISAKNWPEYKNYEDIAMIGIGNCGISAAEKMQNIRKFPSYNEWAANLEDEKLYKLCERLIDHSIQTKIECEKFGIRFFDTSNNFDKVIEAAADYVYTLTRS